MKLAIYSVIGMCMVVAVLVGNGFRSRLPFLLTSVYLIFILIAAVFIKIRTHRVTRELQVLMGFASLFSLIFLLAGAILMIRIPLSPGESIGVENHVLFYEYSMAYVHKGVRPQPKEIGLRTKTASIGSGPPRGWARKFIAPTLLPAMLIALPTGLFWLIRMRPISPGSCTKCDYDLTGNTSGVCPECGQLTTKAA